MTVACRFSGQILPSDIEDLAAQGIKTLINNRPDGESVDQPTQDAIAKAAADVGIAYHYLPFTASALSETHVRAFADIYNQAQKPIHLFCRTGNRSSNLYQIALQMDLLD